MGISDTHRKKIISLKDYDDVLSLEEMCAVLKIGVSTGYKLLREKEVKSLKIGRSYRIPKNSIQQYLGSTPQPA